MDQAVANNQLYTYVIVLRNESSRYVNTVGLLLVVGSALLFSREMMVRNIVIVPYLIGVIFIAALLLWNAYVHFKTDRQIYYSKALLVAGLVWMKMPYFQWLLIVFALLAILEYQAKLSPEIGFSPGHIVFNRLLKKKYSWQEIDNVILKDGLLTIDFKNNKLFQKEIDSGENEASEQEFNEWVRGQLAKSEVKSEK
jgi:hypothetical protein